MTTPASTSPLRAIRAKCLECSNGHVAEVTHCPILTCPLYPLRFGKSIGKVTRILTDDQRAAMLARLKAGRERRLANLQRNEASNEG